MKFPIEIKVNNMNDAADINLSIVSDKDLKTVWEMQKIGFAQWEKKYHDGAITKEPFKKLLERAKRPDVIYYFIMKNKDPIGVICVRNINTAKRKQIAPIWIMPDYLNHGYGQKAIKLLEDIHGTTNWELKTGVKERRNLHFYEKLGYHKTDVIETVNNYLSVILLVK